MPDREDVRRLYASFGQSAALQGYRSFHQEGSAVGMGLPMEDDLPSLDAALNQNRAMPAVSAMAAEPVPESPAAPSSGTAGFQPEGVPLRVPEGESRASAAIAETAAATPLDRIFERLLRDGSRNLTE